MRKAVIVQLYDIQKFFDREMLRDCMDALYNCGVRGKLYRLIFEMNRQNNIRVRTGVGTSDAQETGEGVGQGTLDGALLSAGSIDFTVNKFFSKSSYEISYGSINLQPLLYQDDLFRLCLDPFSAQIGNTFMDNVMESKLLDFNLDKSCYIVIGSKEAKAEVRKELENNPLTLSGKLMKEVESEKYLGDYISAYGAADTAFQTVTKRHQKAMNAIQETKAVIEDCRADVIGGIVAGLEIWEIAVIPYLINNSETWAYMTEKAVEVLDSLQNQFLRSLLATPKGSPTPALLWETGTWTMENRILKRKLLFVHHLVNLTEDSLAYQCAMVQDKLSLPGLISETKDIIKEMELPDIQSVTKLQWKNLVQQKLLIKNKDDLIRASVRYKKINTKEMSNEKFERKPYLTDLRMDNARTKFKIKTKMMKNVKLNFKNDPKNLNSLWKCPECENIDSQQHILWCTKYESLRKDKDLSTDKDLTSYFQQVMLYREKNNK